MSFITTSRGKRFYFDHPEIHEFTIVEIAHALSNICRFTGHVNEFYSVAQHSVYVSALVPYEYKLAALLHDASEAYLGDVSSPLKALLPDYKAIEANVEEAISWAFKRPTGLYPLDPIVKLADRRMLKLEMLHLMPDVNEYHAIVNDTSLRLPGFLLEPLCPSAARELFMRRYLELMHYV